VVDYLPSKCEAEFKPQYHTHPPKKSTDKNHMITSIDAEKALDKIQQLIMRTLNIPEIEGNFLNVINNI
jgi:hypothetical protein